MESMGDCRRSIWGGSNLAILVVMIMLMLWSTKVAADVDVAAVTKNKIFSNRCGGSGGGGGGEECLISTIHHEDEMEFLMDSEASKRIFAASVRILDYSPPLTTEALDRAKPVCDRNGGKRCLPGSNSGTKVPPNCKPESYSKDCHRL